MDIQPVASMISTVGFPIAMCLIIYFKGNEQNEKITEALNNNNVLLQKILTYLKMDNKDKDDE